MFVSSWNWGQNKSIEVRLFGLVRASASNSLIFNVCALGSSDKPPSVGCFVSPASASGPHLCNVAHAPPCKHIWFFNLSHNHRHASKMHAHHHMSFDLRRGARGRVLSVLPMILLPPSFLGLVFVRNNFCSFFVKQNTSAEQVFVEPRMWHKRRNSQPSSQNKNFSRYTFAFFETSSLVWGICLKRCNSLNDTTHSVAVMSFGILIN